MKGVSVSCNRHLSLLCCILGFQVLVCMYICVCVCVWCVCVGVGVGVCQSYKHREDVKL